MQNTEFWTALANSLDVAPAALSVESALPGKGNWESLALMSCMSVINRHFNITVKACELDACSKVNDICLLIQQRTASN